MGIILFLAVILALQSVLESLIPFAKALVRFFSSGPCFRFRMGLILIIILTLFFNFPKRGLAKENLNAKGNSDYSAFLKPPPILTLDECLSIAFRENRTIKQNRSKKAAAQSKKDQIIATQQPGATAQIMETNYSDPPGQTAKDRQELFRLGVSVNLQPFGRNKSLKRAAEAGIRGASAEQTRIEIETAFSVTRTFYDVLLAQFLKKVASDSVDQLREHRNQTARLVETGTAPGFDLLRAEVQLSSVKPNRIRATHSISANLADLLHLLGADPTATPQVIGTFPEKIPDDILLKEEEAIRVAFGNRADLASAKAYMDAMNHSLKAARQALQPSVQLSHTMDQTRGNQQPVDSFQNSRTTQLGLNFPVFDSGLNKAKTKEAAANLEQARLAYESTISMVHVEIRKAISALTESLEVVTSQERNVEQAQEALIIAENAYQTGAKTSLDVLDAQLALTQAKTLRYQALRDRAVALAQLEKALGFMPGHFQENRLSEELNVSQLVPEK